MRHKILAQSDMHPYEVVKVEIFGDNESERNSIKNVDDILADYLALRLNTVEVLENSSPVFLIKRVKQKLGMG